MSAFQSKSKPPKKFAEEKITLKDWALELNKIRILHK